MFDRIIQNKKEIFELCEKHSVSQLYLFGSALSDKFSANSDLDFTVRFNHISLNNYFKNYISLKEKLEMLFERNIDLLEEQSIKNPVLKLSIEKNKQLIYG